MRSSVVVLGFFLLSWLLSSAVYGGSVEGEWVSDDLSVVVRANGDELTGTIQRGTTSFPLTARRTGEGWSGKFTHGDNAFECSAVLADGVMTFRTGSKTYTLKPKSAAPANPLESQPTVPAAPNPLAGTDSPPASPVPPPVPAPVPSPATEPRLLKHPKGFACGIPEGWLGAVGEEYLELYGPMSPTTKQPTSYIRVAVVQDPTFTRIDDVKYIQAAVASMQANEPGLKLDGDARTFNKGTVHLVVIPFMLKVEELPNPVPARALIGEIRDKQIAVIFMACEPAKLKECEDLMIATADDVISGVNPRPPAPAGDVGTAIQGKWSDKTSVWEIGPATLTRASNVAGLQLPGAVVKSPKEQLCHSIKDGKLYVASTPADAWDRTPACQVYTVELDGDQLTLTDSGGKKLVLRREN